MARRRKGYIEDDDIESSDADSSDQLSEGEDLDADERNERQRFNGSRKRKRGKGMFAEDDEEEAGFRGSGRKGKGITRSLHKIPSFVPSSKTVVDGDLNEDTLHEAKENGDIDENGMAIGASDDSGDSDLSEELVEADEMEMAMEESDEDAEANVQNTSVDVRPSFDNMEIPRTGIGAPRAGIGTGLGFATTSSNRTEASPRQGLGSSTAGIGSTNGRMGLGSTAGLGASPSTPINLPSAFGSQNRTQRSFLGSGSGNNTPVRPATPLTHDEKRHFAKLESQGGIGHKLLAKMGWSAGIGLGQEGRGIVTPVEHRMRPQGAGIGATGSSERTRQAITEARRRGENVSDDESGPTGRRKGRKEQKPPKEDRGDAWKKPTKVRKAKTVYKTYEELLKETGEEGLTIDEGIGQIIDVTGAQLPSLPSSLTSHGLGPQFETSHLPELRHNVKYIVDSSRENLEALAREAKALAEKTKWLDGEENRITSQVSEASDRISRLEQISLLTSEIDQVSKTLANDLHISAKASFELYENTFDKLFDNFPDEFAIFSLDEIVVGAVAPILRRAWSEWNPLEYPNVGLNEIKRWRTLLGVDQRTKDSFSAGVNGHSNNSANEPLRNMSAYESAIWNLWLPKVRSALNNHWQPTLPQSALTFFTLWSSILPTFVKDNVLDQLILPKVSKAINDWHPKRSEIPLHRIVFPWLEQAGPRMDELLGEAKRRLRGWLKSWKPKEGIPADLSLWQKVYSKSDWDALILSYIVPPLAAYLRENLQINPRQQDVKPLNLLLEWKDLLRPNIINQILETEFFPKWLDALYIWLTHTPNLEEVNKWYVYWCDFFPSPIATLPGVVSGFRKGLDLQNSAMVLGEDAKYLLRKPDLLPTPTSGKVAAVRAQATSTNQPEITFRSIVEEIAAQNNLIFLPTGRSQDATGHLLFRVSTTVDGKKGITVYLQDDIVWTQEGTEWVPISVEDMVERSKAA